MSVNDASFAGGNRTPLRVLQCVSAMNVGGIETLLMAINRKLDHTKVVFDFLYYVDESCFYDDEIKRLGGKIHRLGLSRKHPVATRRKTNEFFASHPEYRIVHVHMGSMVSLVPVLAAAKRAGVPERIIHAHCSQVLAGSNVNAKINNVVHRLNRRLHGEDATHYMACSADAARWFAYPKEWEFLPNGIDTARFAFDAAKRKGARAELGIDEDAFVVGNVGRLSPPKNQSFLLEVFARVLKQRPTAKLLLVGGGELEATLRNKARALGIERSVIHLKNRIDTDRLYSSMDVFCFPSLYEGFGIALLEAEASGLPCVISDNVPMEGEVVNCFRLPLSSGADVWAKKIFEGAGVCGCRMNAAQAVRDAGFDIADAAIYLQEKYGEWARADYISDR